MSTDNNGDDEVELKLLSSKKKAYKSKNGKCQVQDDDELESLNNANKTANHNNNESSSKNNTKNKLKTIRKTSLFDLAPTKTIFKCKELEVKYKKSYLAISRLFFAYYTFYLILTSVCWIIYYSIDNSAAPVPINVVLTLTNETATQQATYAALAAITGVTKSNMLVYFYSGFLVILVSVFTFLLVSELSETQYKTLKSDLKTLIVETKVDTRVAETNLKEAVKKYIESEVEIDELKTKLNVKYKSVANLRKYYMKFANKLAFLILMLLVFFELVSFFYKPYSFTYIGHFISYCECLFIIYIMYPFKFVIVFVLALAYTIAYEYLSLSEQYVHITSKYNQTTSLLNFPLFVTIKIIVNIVLHLTCIYFYKLFETIKLNTFVNVAKLDLVHINAEQDKIITETMIKSIMPPLFTHIFGKPEEFKESVNTEYKMRPLYVYPIDNISILYADIVGFTKMSSNKTAEELVFLLNDLYGRFDRLCEKVGCEKISTLGDCYYCVSGCLNGRLDHAKCCVEMGLSMVKEIESFNKAHGVDVNMRVGVHTGKALCGFIGGKRFRFDVWSSDVSTANKMESSGRAGWVHISHATYEQIQTEYTFENAEKQSGYSTYFVVPDERRKLKMPTVADALLANPATLIGTQISMQSNDSTTSLQVNTPSPNNDDNESSDTEKSDPNKSAIAIVEQQPANKEEILIKAIHDIEFFRPNLNVFTLFFNNRLEQEYKNFLIGYKATPADNDTMANEFGDGCAFSQLLEKNSVKFWSNPPNTLFSSLFISFLINFAVSLAYLLSYIASDGDFKNTDKIFIKILVPFLIINITQLVFLLIYFYKFTTFFKQNKHQTTLFTFKDNSGTQGNTTIVAKHAQQQQQQQPVAYMKTISKTAESKQRIRNTNLKLLLLYLTSFIFVSIVPVYMLTNGLSVVCHFFRTNGASTSSSTKSQSPLGLNMFLVYYSITYAISLVNICVFVQLNKLFKHFLIFLFTFFYFLFMFYLNFELCNRVLTPQHDVAIDNVTLSTNIEGLDWLGGVLLPLASTDSPTTAGYYNLLNRNYILVLDFLLYLIFLYIINRQFEIVNRLAFVCDQDSTKQIKTNNEQKELANWLIDVVLPAHVVEHVQARKQYSRNYDCVGVLFVSLCNYSEFYEEKFLGGRELIRILNEITVDFDRLFDDPKYQNIEKIKNIGSTFMIASGLCPTTSYNDDDANRSPNKNTRDKHQHLYDLIEFALNLWEKLETFNNDAMSVCHFQFQMRMGFNFGPVTAGVIGEERLLYDIWGDTVNVASRMDSTGQAGVLQAPESAASFLSNKYIFHHRGEIQVKGKDKMITYFLKPKENDNLSGHCGGALLPE